MARRRLRCEDYNVGWVCALPIELAAAREMLDEEHQDLSQDLNDTNIYTLGRIGEHNVVLVCLPAGRIGNNCATAVTIEMKSKFTAIRFGLMVGIGGGVPSAESDVRLGDVVVSRPYMEHGGVIQYDFGKTTPSGFVRTGYLNTPPTVLLNALAKLQSQHLRGRSNLAAYLPQRFAYDNVEPDILFESTYNHVGGPTCGRCSKDRLVERTSHRTQEVMVHCGTIASGNQVIKDGVTRDILSSELGGVLCFEMEAAGLMNNFPCLVIRGICDYADSHKNKRWQPYAAATAAAFAKEFLSIIPALKEVRSVVGDEIRRIPARATNQYQNIASEFINNNLSNFYDRDSAFLEVLAQTATARAQRATEEFGLGPEFIPKLAKLGLYDFVILCGRPSTSHSSIETLSQQ
jgi:nucleoside phosphorylase